MKKLVLGALCAGLLGGFAAPSAATGYCEARVARIVGEGGDLGGYGYVIHNYNGATEAEFSAQRTAEDEFDGNF